MSGRTLVSLRTGYRVLSAALAAGVVAFCLGLAPVGSFPSDVPRELAYVPAKLRLIAFIDLRALPNSEFRQSVLRSETGRTVWDAFEARTGINVEADVERLVTAFQESAPEGDSDAPLVIARGRFDQGRIDRVVAADGGEVAEYRGSRLWSRAEQDGVRRALVFLEPTLVAFGPEALVKRSIDAKRDAADISTDAALLTLVRGVAGGQLWAVGRFDELTTRAGLPTGVVEQLPEIHWFSASGRVDADVHVQARAEARDEAAAQELRDVLRGFVALIRAQPGQRRDVRALASSLEIGGEGRTVSLLFSAPAALLGALQHLAP